MDWKMFKRMIKMARNISTQVCRMNDGNGAWLMIQHSWKVGDEEFIVDLNPYAVNLKTGYYFSAARNDITGDYITVPNIKHVNLWGD